MRETHQKYMHRCLQLAKKGMGNVSPNPMVGCVIVYSGKIIGEGYHRKYGEHHAEVNAINSVKDEELLKKSVLYVSLEPCSHHGKTPPCADLLIEKNIPEVVIGSIDPNPEVAGKGIEKLKKAGIQVTTGIIEKECKKLNRRFYTYHTKKRPYIIFKWAQTNDGFIDIIREFPSASNSKPGWITNEFCRTLVHKWRTEEDAFMIGTKTAVMDNPRLTARNWEGKNPVRIVIDRSLKIPKSQNIFDNAAETIVFNETTNKTIKNTRFIKIEFGKKAIFNILTELYNLKVQSIVVEGGTFTINEFISCGLWDEARIFRGMQNYKNGIKAPEFNFPVFTSYDIQGCLLNIYKNTDNEFN